MGRTLTAIGAVLMACASTPGLPEAPSQTTPVVAALTTTDTFAAAADVAVPSVLRVSCTSADPAKAGQGTGFLHKSGRVISAEHVVRGCSPAQLRLVSATGAYGVTHVVVDATRDLALLTPDKAIDVPAFPVASTASLKIGEHVHTWGFPGGYRAIRPLLTAGVLAGEDVQDGRAVYVVNAALNRGNSGGPLVRTEDSTVLGVVISKLAPLPEEIKAILEGLERTNSGFQYTMTRPTGETVSFSEAQLVAKIAEHLRDQVQLVIGFSVKTGDLRAFLQENGVEP